MALSPNQANRATKPDYGTPPNVVEAARYLLGRIDLDPASSAKRNIDTIHAMHFFDSKGLDLPWHGCVFLNPPGGVGANGTKAWWNKLCQEYSSGSITAAIFVAFSIEGLQWSQGTKIPMLNFPIWIPSKRIAYLDHDTGIPIKSPPKPSAIIWLPETKTVEELKSQNGNVLTDYYKRAMIKAFNKIAGVPIIPVSN